VSKKPIKVKATLVPVKKQRQPWPTAVYVMPVLFRDESKWCFAVQHLRSGIETRHRDLLEAGHTVGPIYMVQLPGEEG